VHFGKEFYFVERLDYPTAGVCVLGARCIYPEKYGCRRTYMRQLPRRFISRPRIYRMYLSSGHPGPALILDQLADEIAFSFGRIR